MRTQLKTKTIGALLIALLMTLWVPMFALAAEGRSASDTDIAELKEMVTMLAEQRMIESRSLVDFRAYENLHLHPEYRSYMTDARFSLLREVNELIMEAFTTQNWSRGIAPSEFILPPISGVGGPHGSFDGRFTIAFTSPEYLELIDFIADFIGVERNMINVEIADVARFLPLDEIEIHDEVYQWEIGIYDEDYIGEFEDIEARFGSAISMGTSIMFRDPVTHVLRDMGTLGHPRDSSGNTAFGANHGVVPRNAGVYINGGTQRIGVVQNIATSRPMGIDVSYIRMENGFTVSNRVPGTTTNITNFFANTGPTAPNNLARVVSRNGTRLTLITDVSHDAHLFVGGQWVTYFGVIRGQGGATGGDSGSALVLGSNVFGTLFGGNNERSYFSRSPAYQFVR